MSKEIKFRGKGIDGEWHYGLLSISFSKRIGHPSHGHYISDKYGSPWGYLVQPETVGEYIGMKDLHGKEIYEGDILSSGDNFLSFVEYDNDTCAFILMETQTVSGEYAPREHEIGYQKGPEIMGNIHDHKAFSWSVAPK